MRDYVRYEIIMKQRRRTAAGCMLSDKFLVMTSTIVKH